MVCRWVWHFGWENVFRRQVWDPKPHSSSKSSAVLINCINVATANSDWTNAFLEKETGANIFTQDLATIPCRSVVPQPAKISRITYKKFTCFLKGGSHAEDGVQQPPHLLFPWWRCGQKLEMSWNQMLRWPVTEFLITSCTFPTWIDQKESAHHMTLDLCSPVGFPSMELPCGQEQVGLLGTSIFWFLRYCSIFTAHYINIYIYIYFKIGDEDKIRFEDFDIKYQNLNSSYVSLISIILPIYNFDFYEKKVKYNIK